MKRMDHKTAQMRRFRGQLRPIGRDLERFGALTKRQDALPRKDARQAGQNTVSANDVRTSPKAAIPRAAAAQNSASYSIYGITFDPFSRSPDGDHFTQSGYQHGQRRLKSVDRRRNRNRCLT